MSDNTDLPSILLVTASSQTAKSLNLLLSDQFLVVHAISSEQAWDILQQNITISVVVCELALAVDNFVLLERIRRVENKVLASKAVLLLVSENDDEESCEQAFIVGATDFINMPFSSIELKTRIRLHSKLSCLHHRDSAIELVNQSSSVDTLSILMQEKYFLTVLEQELSFSARHQSFVSLSLIKIDDARLIEEKFSKKTLTSVLRAVAKIIQNKLRKEDTCVYLGDDTFALLYPVTNGLGANIAIKRLINHIQKSVFKQRGAKILVKLSVALYSTLPSDDLTAERAMTVVEKRLEKAQKQGGAQIVNSKAELVNNKISIEQALNMISFQRTEPLLNKIPEIVDSLIPLLEFIQKNNELEFNRILDNMDDTPE